MADNKENNPRNVQSTLYRKLTRLLSGPLTARRRQLPRQLRRAQLDKYQARFKSASGQQFKKSEYNPYDILQYNTMVNQNRAERYVDFDQMEYMPEIASSMDIYADEMTTSTEFRPLLSIKCSNEEIKYTLETLYSQILNVEFNLFGWCRTMCKYGDFFLYLDIDERAGITHAVGIPPSEIERLEGEDKTNPNYVQFQWNTAGMTFENWQLAHFRILGNDKYAPYGTSVLEPARRIWRQLTLMEDAVMAYRIVRSPERRVFYIDVGNIAPEDVEQYMQKIMTQMKRNQLVDANTGKVDLRYNPMNIEEDYYIPVRGGTSSKIETLAGGSYTGDIDDIKYLRDKLFAALKVPASYLSRAEGADEDKTTLAQKDIRFARTIHRLQRAVVSELEKIGIVHLFTLGFRGDDLVSFKISLNNPSRLAEMQELETWRTKFEIAGGATEGYFSKRRVSENILNVTAEEHIRMQREMFHDKKFDALLEKSVEEAAAGGADTAGAGGLGGGDLGGLGGGEADLGGGDLGGDDAGGGDLGGDLGADLGGDTGGADETPAAPEGGGDDSPVLAAPAKRDDGRKFRGPYRRQQHSQWNHERRGNAMRSYFPGGEINTGIDMGKRLAFSLFEENETNYKDQERKLLESNYEIKKLVNLLEEKDNEASS